MCRSGLLSRQAGSTDIAFVSVPGLPFADRHVQLWREQADGRALGSDDLLRVCKVRMTFCNCEARTRSSRLWTCLQSTAELPC